MKTGYRVAALALALVMAAPLALADKKNDERKSPDAAAQQANQQYVIGPADVLGISVWREAELSGQVQVRPDGKISLPLLNDVQASGLTAEQLATELTTRLKKFVEEPRVTVSVIQINSKKIFIVGEVARAGAMPLTSGMTILQALAQAGGFSEFADTKKIYVMRSEKGQIVKYPVNYKNLLKGRSSEQNFMLMAGDTIVVP
jgi:polysaccharide export outer membrane protein